MAKLAELAAETAETLLKRIGQAAADESDPGRLKALADSYALVMSNTPRNAGRGGGLVA